MNEEQYTSLDILTDIVERVYAGADPTPRVPNSWPTANQVWWELLQADENKRIEFLSKILDGYIQNENRKLMWSVGRD